MYFDWFVFVIDFCYLLFVWFCWVLLIFVWFVTGVVGLLVCLFVVCLVIWVFGSGVWLCWFLHFWFVCFIWVLRCAEFAVLVCLVWTDHLVWCLFVDFCCLADVLGLMMLTFSLCFFVWLIDVYCFDLILLCTLIWIWLVVVAYCLVLSWCLWCCILDLF